MFVTPSTRRQFRALLWLFAVGGALPISAQIVRAAPKAATAATPNTKATSKPTAPAVDANWSQPLRGDVKIVHALNRLAFGPRPGDVEVVKAMGLDAWINQQMHPQTIDDGGLDDRLTALTLLRETPDRLQLAFEGDRGEIRRYLQMKNQGLAVQTAANNADLPKKKQATELSDAQQTKMQEFEASGMKLGVSAQATGELVTAKLARAIDSKRQLQEVLADFWGNHFNVDVSKGPVRVYKLIDDRDAIRPHLFGTFRELLGASAKSPAMLWYLDNARSTAPKPARGGKQRGGLNENYGRELMELHTLGVDGGYTQKDVTEVARCFTGWSIGKDGTFEFHPRLHDNGEKIVLGQRIPAGGGQNDGERVLDMLASSPSTAKFIAHELCQRFVADDPPASLVTRVAAAFTASNGDLPTVYKAIFTAPEFWSQGAYRAKIKSPLEYAVSAVRALDGHFLVPDPTILRDRALLVGVGGISAGQGRNGRKIPRHPVAQEISQMGQPLFDCQPPTGWSEHSASWVSTAAIVSRLNYALALTNGQIGDVQLQNDTLRAEPVADLADQLLGVALSPSTSATIESEVKQAPQDGAKARALILGSPEFQRR